MPQPAAQSGLRKVEKNMKRIESVNDFVVKFANVNGSGSASANELFARSILRMGVPVSPRNIFPSNIQGLPTWYEVRVNETGYQGRRGGVDLMVAMNPQTWDADVKEIESGGYLFYDSSKPLPKSKFPELLTCVFARIRMFALVVSIFCSEMVSSGTVPKTSNAATLP